MGIFDAFIDKDKITEGREPEQSRVETASVPVSAHIGAVTVDPDEKWTNMLNQALEEIADADNDNDILTFVKSTQKTAKLVPDEATRFKVSAENLGVDVNAIVQSGSRYFEKLKREKAEFMESQKSLEDTEITALVDKSAVLERDIKDAKEEIVRLNSLIQTNTAEVSKIAENLASAKVRLANRQATFEASYVDVENSIKTNIEKVKIYLSGESK